MRIMFSITVASLFVSAGASMGDVVSSASVDMKLLDTTVATSDVTMARFQSELPVAYSAVLWNDMSQVGQTAMLEVDGDALLNAEDEGIYVWRPTRAGAHGLRLTVNGVTFAKVVHVPASEVQVERIGVNLCKLTASDGVSPIRYTLDGTDPTAESALYDGPFLIPLSRMSFVRACTQGEGYVLGEVKSAAFDIRGRCESSFETFATIDSRAGKPVVPVDGVTRVAWSGLWSSDSEAEVTVDADGAKILMSKGEGSIEYYPTAVGRHVLTHETRKDGVAVGEKLTATIDVLPVLKKGRVIKGVGQIAEGTTEIADGAFANFSDMTSVVIPKTVTHIALTAFAGCGNITNIILHGGVLASRQIMPELVEGTKWIEETETLDGDKVYKSNVINHNQSTEIEFEILEGMEQLVFSWKIGSEGNFDWLTWYLDNVQKDRISGSRDWVVLTNELDGASHRLKFVYSKDGSQSTSPDCGWVSVHGSGRKPTKLKDLFPDSPLVTVVIGNEVKALPEGFFADSTMMESVSLPDALPTIGRETFKGCSSLAGITIPSGVTNIGENTFLGCKDLKRVDVASFKDWLKIKFANAAANPLATGAALYVDGKEVTELVIPEGVTEIGEYAFAGGQFTSVTIPNSVTNISVTAFAGCSNVVDVVLPLGADTVVPGFYEAEIRDMNTFSEDNDIEQVARATVLSADMLTAETAPEHTMYGYAAYMWFEGGVTYEFLAYYDDKASIRLDGDWIIQASSSECRSQTGTARFENDGWHWIEIRGWNNAGEGAAYGSCSGVKWRRSGEDWRLFADTGDGALFRVDGVSFGLRSVLPDSYAIVKSVVLVGDDGVVPKAFLKGCVSLESVELPDTVESIDAQVFEGCIGLRAITIPSSLRFVGADAFLGCENLKRVDVASLEDWLKIEFANDAANPLYYGAELYVNGEKIVDLVVPEGIREIGDGAFRGCSDLRSVMIPSSVTNIATTAFEGCSNIVSATVGCPKGAAIGLLHLWNFNGDLNDSVGGADATIVGNVTTDGRQYKTPGGSSGSAYIDLGDNLVPRECEAVTLEFWATQDSRGSWDRVFDFGSMPTGYDFSRYSTAYSSHDNVVMYWKGDATFCTYSWGMNVAREYHIAASYSKGDGMRWDVVYYIQPSDGSGVLTKVECEADDGWSFAKVGQTEWLLGQPLTCWDSCAKASYNEVRIWNRAITEEEFKTATEDGPDKVKIGAMRLRSIFPDSSVRFVKINDDVTDMPDGFFADCTALESVTLPDALMTVGLETFKGCSSLVAIAIPSCVTNIGENAFLGCENLKRVDVASLEDWLKIEFANDAANPLYYGAELYVNGEKIVDLVVPEGIREIGDGAFRGCSDLRSVMIPSSVTNIGNSAFSGCSSLASLTIPPSVTSIGEAAFYGCRALTSVTIPASVTSIGRDAFEGCSGVKEYIVEEGNQNYKVISGLLMTKDGKTLIAGVNGARIVLSSVAAQQRYPWNGKVDITVVIYGTGEDVAQYDCVFAATNGATKAEIPIDHIAKNGDDVGAEGVWTRKFIWDATADIGEVTIENVELTVGYSLRGVAKATTGVSSEFCLDTRTCAREAKAAETIVYSASWESDDVNAVAEVAVDGEVIKSASGTGVVDWTPIQNGTYLLTHKVMVAGKQVGETLSATFIVTGLNPENPVIEPVSGTVFTDTLSISMTCASEDATIYYTTDGSEPTKESMVYSRRFRIFDKTTIKARAFYENGDGSEVVTACYALGQCPDPVIVSEGGETFLHKDNQISIDWECEDGILRYTIDGSDVTETSSEYIRPFMIDDTTVIKAKAFGEAYFDSEQVELTATRDWEAVATPNIVAAETFSGTKTMVSISCETEGATIRYTINGSEPNAHSRRYAGSFEVRETTIVKAYATLNDYADSEVATKTITKVWVIGDSVGLPDHAFKTDGDAQWVNDGGAAMKSGKITHNQTTSMKSTFIGKGKLSFELRTSCEEDDPAYIEYDHAEFLVNGELKLKRDGVHDWEVYEYDFDEGEHSVEWKYVKDTLDDAKYPGEDCIWVRKIVWLPELTCTTEVPVKLSWIREKFGDLGNYYYDYEEKAKETAQNGHKVWECYVAGEEPKDPLSKFTAIITVVDGKPIISWTPEVKDESGKYLRKYTVYGKAKLTDEQWEVVPEGREDDYNFFKVTVEML